MTMTTAVKTIMLKVVVKMMIVFTSAEPIEPQVIEEPIIEEPEPEAEVEADIEPVEEHDLDEGVDTADEVRIYP